MSRIYDGDTVTCRDGTKIRLLLIDAPEMGQREIGRAARSALLRIMPLGTPARIETDVEKQDRYGRTLAYLHLPDGRMVNEELARAGYALVLSYPPNVKHIERIRCAVEEARGARRGLWGTYSLRVHPPRLPGEAVQLNELTLPTRSLLAAPYTTLFIKENAEA